MAIPETLQIYLSSRHVSHVLVTHPPTRQIQRAAVLAGLAPGRVVRAVLLRAESRPWLAALPADRVLDFSAVQRLLGVPAEIVPSGEATLFFPDCASRTTPAVGMAWGVPTLLDDAVPAEGPLYLAAGRADRLLRVETDAFRRLFENARRVAFSEPATAAVGEEPAVYGDADPALERLQHLPPMPGIAAEVLRLSQDPDASAADLARLVSDDPSLSAQLVRYARSPLLGGGDHWTEDVHAAVHRVLGFDMVVGITIGLAVSRPFRLPANGPLGLSAFWRQATYSGALVRMLTRQLALEQRPTPGFAYLAGLLHNFGYLVLGHLFRREFEMLNRLMAVDTRARITDVERQVLAPGQARQAVVLGHAGLGARLLERWGLPAPVVTAAAEHHNPGYRGEHAAVVDAVLIADRLLRRLPLGDGDSEGLPQRALERLALNGDEVEIFFDRLLAEREGLDYLARQMAA